MEVIVLMDGSVSIDTDGFEVMKAHVHRFFATILFDDAYTYLMQFGSSVAVMWEWQIYETALRDMLLGSAQIGGNTNTFAAISQAIEAFTKSPRTGYTRYLYLVTHGYPEGSDVCELNSMLALHNIRLIVTIVGNYDLESFFICISADIITEPDSLQLTNAESQLLPIFRKQSFSP